VDWKNLAQRVAVAVVFIPLILYVIYAGNVLFLLLIEIIIVAGALELYNLASRKNAKPNRWLGVAGSAAIAPMIYFDGTEGLWILVTALVVALVVVELFRAPESGSGPLINVAVTLFGVLYVAGLLSFLLAIRELPKSTGHEYAHAGTWVLMIFLTIWICDTAAYFVGMALGKRPLFERVSPRKTIAGAVGGIIFAILAAAGCHLLFVQGLRLIDSLVIGLLAGTVGQVSDLAESLFKRDAGVKDSSLLIPGHGGVLDRFDSEMLVAPLVYLYLIVFAL